MELSNVKKQFFEYVNQVISNNKISHAYLIELNNYDLDLNYIYDFIKMILCNLKYEDLVDSDNSIISLIDNRNYPDIVEIEPDGMFIKKEQLLSLQREFSNKSLLDNKRIYIIKQAECLNKSSANTMLKFLEEPEDDIIALLLTNNRYHVLETIRSRCQILNLKDSVQNEYSDDDINFFKFILFPKDFFINYNLLVKDGVSDKTIMKTKLEKVKSMIIDYLNFKYKVHDKINEDLLNLCKNKKESDLLKYLSIIEREIKKFDYNVNYKLWIDGFLAQLLIGE